MHDKIFMIYSPAMILYIKEYKGDNMAKKNGFNSPAILDVTVMILTIFIISFMAYYLIKF